MRRLPSADVNEKKKEGSESTSPKWPQTSQATPYVFCSGFLEDSEVDHFSIYGELCRAKLVPQVW